DQDASVVSRKIVDAIARDPAIEVQPALPLDAVEAQVRSGKTTVAAVIPQGFGEQAGRAFFRGQNKPEVRLLYDPSHAAEVGMVRGFLTQHVMEVVSSESFSGDSSQKLLEDFTRDA